MVATRISIISQNSLEPKKTQRRRGKQIRFLPSLSHALSLLLVCCNSLTIRSSSLVIFVLLSMVSVLPTCIHLPKFPLLCKTNISRSLCHGRASMLNSRKCRIRLPVNVVGTNSFDSNYLEQQQQQQQQQQPRTLFPGGFKRPEIKVPTVVLQLKSDEVLRREGVLDSIDAAVSKWVGIVVLNDADGSGGRLYEAARLLKSVIRDRAYLLIAERVDIAAAVSASGVLLSDQGLPAIVARNMMMQSKSDSVVLPLVARNVQTANTALSASSFEGADFLIYDTGKEIYDEVLVNPVFQNVKIPVFTSSALLGWEPPFTEEASKLLKSGGSGLVISLEDMKMFSGDVLSKLFNSINVINKRTQDEPRSSNTPEKADFTKDLTGKEGYAGFFKLEDREKQFIETERVVLKEAIATIRKAAPLMEEVSLLADAFCQLDEPFLLVIVGEFNSGKSTVINALLGGRYLKEGVVPTTNEITLLCYSELDSYEQERCERRPDGQFICYLPAPILKQMNLVDTPGTNVILQRQQRLTEEFVPRADLILFVISADRPLTQSEVAFLHYIQQWKKKVVFVLNKSDIYRTTSELEEAIAFIKENTGKLLNAENVTLYPVSARSALEAKLLASASAGKDYEELLWGNPHWRTSCFDDLEKFLYSFLDGSTNNGMERMKLKLETPIRIADRLLSACEVLVREDCKSANQDLTLVNEMVNSVKRYAAKMESESLSWRRQTLSLINNAKGRALKLVGSTLQLSNLDLVASYVFKGEKLGSMPATSSIQNEIISPALSDAQKLLGEYLIWLQSSNVREGRLYKESFEKRWPEFVYPHNEVQLEAYELLKKGEELSLKVIEDFNASAAAKLFEQEIREVVLGTFGGLGAAGLSASLLTSVLPTTLEDLLALGLCSAGGLLAISNFPTRRREMEDKVKRAADILAREVKEAMQRDLLKTIEDLENFVKLISKPYQDAAQSRLDKILEIQEELLNVEKRLQTLQIEIQNLHVS
ncbi:PREDICTED: probable transmembrane GTPase FZO-like, chloroplastic isoform X2 [Nelumbo nucifera]|uniref:Probable transmembrane GTPase FZO-like, chloroplastic isoform X2 n=1 Tax=Nelumbo nucifera TaxID=4432 RepID=A0A1U8A2P7_NELNU|nr:PREDICTED: probable transmembrane GTPase FZO-like, chloroplastic isoform X2 [Nelumbo nucifera]